jgi:peptide/nickel transport system substrate-binding protein
MQMKRFGKMNIDEHPGVKFDPDGAKMLLKEAGYNGEEISYRYLQDYYTNEVSTAQVLAAMWKDVGLNVKLELMENWSQIEDSTADEGRGVINWSSTAVYPDPIGQLLRMFGPNGFFQRNDFWGNEKFNELGEVLMTTNHDARRKAMAEMLDIFEQDPPATYLHVLPMFYGKSEAIKWEPYGTAFMDFRAGSLSID